MFEFRILHKYLTRIPLSKTASVWCSVVVLLSSQCWRQRQRDITISFLSNKMARTDLVSVVLRGLDNLGEDIYWNWEHDGAVTLR